MASPPTTELMAAKKKPAAKKAKKKSAKRRSRRTPEKAKRNRPRWKWSGDAFLDALAKTGDVTKSAKSVGIVRSVAYDRRGTDPGFAERWDDTMEADVDATEADFVHKARDGWTETTLERMPVTTIGLDGEAVTTHELVVTKVVKKWSPTPAIFLLKTRRAAIYAERYQLEQLLQRGGGNPREFAQELQALADEMRAMAPPEPDGDDRHEDGCA